MIREIRFEKEGIYIQGKYRLLLASSFFYFRIPHERWEDRMKLLRAAGYNAIDVYFPWNYHEIAPGNWCFEQARDVKAFLKLAAENQLFVIARPGPYICSEWDGGAIPAWLWERKAAVRQDDSEFLEEVGKWYAHILPVLAEYQIGCGGTVICMQIENELDFYQCISPVSYMEKLKEKAIKMGIEVPLFYCCGQNDLLRGGGLTPELYTAFNVYADETYPNLEERALHLYSSVQERSMPFLVTETNREHSFLKRLLACGAKLLSPYNQTASCTMDFYNSITNWGTAENPLALMASDYDFNSMIGSAGEVNNQFREARMLSGFLNSLQDSISRARPEVAADVRVISGGRVNTVIPRLVLKDGSFLEISNLDSARILCLQAGEWNFQIQMRAMETKLLPWRFKVTEDCEIVYCNYEIGWVERGSRKTLICLYGSGTLDCMVSGNDGMRRIQREVSEEILQFEEGKVVFIAGTLEIMADRHVPGLMDLTGIPCEQRRKGNLDGLWKSCGSLRCKKMKEGPVQFMETMGQYNKIGCYAFDLQQDGEYLIAKAADLLTIQNGDAQEILYSNGGCRTRCFQKGILNIFTEIWGHSNFDDIRCPSLRMGSLKGIDKLVEIKRKEDISEGWLFDLDESEWGKTVFFRHSPYNTIMGIDGYNRAASPLRTIYDRYITSDMTEDALFLHFSKADCMAVVYVNNQYVGMVQKMDPYIDLSDFAGSGRIELTVRTLRRYYTDKLGQVTLIGGKKINRCLYGEAFPARRGEWENCQLPCFMKEGENWFLRLKPEKTGRKDKKLFFAGRDIKLTVYAGGHTVGRILLQEDDMPAVKGGRRDVVYLCEEWCEDICIWCQATGKHPVLENIAVEEYDLIV